jgi:uncharacterized protein
MLCQQSELIEVRRMSNRGRGARGVFARVDIPVDTLIERAPVLLIPRSQVIGPQAAARLSWYVFEWTATKRPYAALALGYGSIYNHSNSPNARYQFEAPDVIEFVASRDIAKDEEIFIQYHGQGEPLGFEAYE